MVTCAEQKFAGKKEKKSCSVSLAQLFIFIMIKLNNEKKTKVHVVTVAGRVLAHSSHFTLKDLFIRTSSFLLHLQHSHFSFFRNFVNSRVKFVSILFVKKRFISSFATHPYGHSSNKHFLSMCCQLVSRYYFNALLFQRCLLMVFLRRGNSNVRNYFLAQFKAKRVVSISQMDPFIMCTFCSLHYVPRVPFYVYLMPYKLFLFAQGFKILVFNYFCRLTISNLAFKGNIVSYQIFLFKINIMMRT